MFSLTSLPQLSKSDVNASCYFDASNPLSSPIGTSLATPCSLKGIRSAGPSFQHLPSIESPLYKSFIHDSSRHDIESSLVLSPVSDSGDNSYSSLSLFSPFDRNHLLDSCISNDNIDPLISSSSSTISLSSSMKIEDLYLVQQDRRMNREVYLCKLCTSHPFISKSTIKKHINYSHSKKPHCPYCEAEIRADNMSRHIKKYCRLAPPRSIENSKRQWSPSSDTEKKSVKYFASINGSEDSAEVLFDLPNRQGRLNDENNSNDTGNIKDFKRSILDVNLLLSLSPYASQEMNKSKHCPCQLDMVISADSMSKNVFEIQDSDKDLLIHFVTSLEDLRSKSDDLLETIQNKSAARLQKEYSKTGATYRRNFSMSNSLLNNYQIPQMSSS